MDDALVVRVARELHPDPALLLCGEEDVRCLRDYADQLAQGNTPTSSEDDALDALAEAAYRQMSAARDSTCWRRLYTDACILRSLSDVLAGSARAESAIGRLDRALVLAGAPGEGRLDLIHDLIAHIQHSHLPTPAFIAPSSPPPPPPPAADAYVHPLPTAARRISALATAPSLAAFQRTHAYTPFILRGHFRAWPALTTHPWASPAYLRAAAGRARVVPVEIGTDYRAEDWDQALLPWDTLLDALALDGAADGDGDGDASAAAPPSHGDAQLPSVPNVIANQTRDARALYLAQHDLLAQFPALRADIAPPDYVYAAPRAPVDARAYTPPRNAEQLVVNAWLGPAGTVSPAHTDPYFNCYAQVVGRKTVWLAPPSATPGMYPYPATSSSTSTDAPHNRAANHAEPSMSNTTRVDVFAPAPPSARSNEGTQDEDEDERFALFWREAVPRALSATIGPGDLLCFPPGWWHAMRAEETSFSVSMWF